MHFLLSPWHLDVHSSLGDCKCGYKSVTAEQRFQINGIVGQTWLRNNSEAITDINLKLIKMLEVSLTNWLCARNIVWATIIDTVQLVLLIFI